MSGRVHGAVRWLFEDRRTGRIVVGQNPNLLALLVVASCAARLVVPKADRAGPALRNLGTCALSLWALDELLRGVNPFRRIGGAAVLATIATSTATSNGTRIVASADVRTGKSSADS